MVVAETPSLVENFESLRPQYEAYTARLEVLIRSLLETESIEFFAIEPRTKTKTSFAEKLQREDKFGKYKAVEDVTDLSGIRIIAYLQQEADTICDLIEKNFELDEVNSVRKQDELDPDKFGYLSTHYVVSLTSNRAELPEFTRFGGLKAEIQVRTLLQHTWAAIDWKFRYKEEREAPKQLRRRLFRISALLEAADNEFSGVRSEIDALRKRYSEEIERGDLDISVNTESVRSYASESATWKGIIRTAIDNGVQLAEGDDGPALNRLIFTTSELGLTTLADLDRQLNELSPQSATFFKTVVPIIETAQESKFPLLFPPAVIRYLLLSSAPAAKRRTLAAAFPWAKGYMSALDTYLGIRPKRAPAPKTKSGSQQRTTRVPKGS